MRKKVNSSFLYILSLVFAQNQVLVLDGENDFVSIAAPVVNTATFTIEAWANMNSAGGGSQNNNPIFIQRTETTGDGHTMTGLKSETDAYTNQTAGFTIRGSDNSTQTIYSPSRNYNE